MDEASKVLNAYRCGAILGGCTFYVNCLVLETFPVLMIADRLGPSQNVLFPATILAFRTAIRK